MTHTHTSRKTVARFLLVLCAAIASCILMLIIIFRLVDRDLPPPLWRPAKQVAIQPPDVHGNLVFFVDRGAKLGGQQTLRKFAWRWLQMNKKKPVSISETYFHRDNFYRLAVIVADE